MAVLGSGSRGNSVLIESGEHRLLLDAGFSCRETERRLEGLGVDASSIGAIVLTHEHADHCRGVERLVKRHGIPVHGTAGTLGGRVPRRVAARAHSFKAGSGFEVPGFYVEPFSVAHDAREPVGFVVESACGTRIGLVADLGVRSRQTWQRLRDLDALVIETNYDPELLETGPYPWFLKNRIQSHHGHLSNEDAAEGLREVLSDTLDTVVLYHLSETNNTPGLAVAAVAEVLEDEGSDAQLVVCAQAEPTGWIGANGPLPVATSNEQEGYA